MLQAIADTIRALTMDAVEQAGSGHPGLPMGCAELGAYLFAEFLRYNPTDPKWKDRDRLILSAGHGSLWLYTSLHLAGFPITIDDIKHFRQFGSKTPSHPDCTRTEGIEATTGVDGQGIGFAVGQALALKTQNLSSKVVVLAGDGCFMEGISSESCSLAGHLNLNNLIVIYDSNRTTLDGYVEEAFSENIHLRFQAQDWDVRSIDGHDFKQMQEVFAPLRFSQNKPTLVIAHTTIGRGSPAKEGTPSIHGKPLGAEEIKRTKERLGLPLEPFYVDPHIYSFFQKISFPSSLSPVLFRPNLKSVIQSLPLAHGLATRWVSHEILQVVAQQLPEVIVGSADLSSSDGTFIRDQGYISKDRFDRRNIKYGVREFAMGCMAAGMAQTGYVLPVIGTFLAFMDYMKSAIRMTSLMRLKVVYHLTHDSIFVGHDGPTHQPIEQLSSLRATPGLLVIRPADCYETKMAWIAALEHPGPTALVLSRQPLAELPHHHAPDEALRGAYIIKKEQTSSVEYLLIATGSEVQLALEVADALGSGTRVISMPSWELFEKQPRAYQRELLQGNIKISLEAGSDQGWHKYIGSDGLAIAISTFGTGGSIADLRAHFGYTKEQILQKIREHENE